MVIYQLRMNLFIIYSQKKFILVYLILVNLNRHFIYFYFLKFLHLDIFMSRITFKFLFIIIYRIFFRYSIIEFHFFIFN